MNNLDSYIKQTKQLISLVNDHITPMYQSSYDTAWVSQVRGRSGELRWPHLSQWLIDNQHDDGSWGGEIYYPHDRVITTLAVCNALKKNENSLPFSVDAAISKGEAFLNTNVLRLSHAYHELVGFELIYPMLCYEASQIGVTVPTYANGYAEMKKAKLSRVPAEMIYSPHSTTAHSFEFLGDTVDRDLINGVVGPSGVANSPSATAYFLTHAGSHKDADLYLEGIIEQGVIPYAYPCKLFELIWALNALSYSGAPITEFIPPSSPIWRELNRVLDEHGGAGFDETFGIIDGDDTAVAAKLLQLVGHKISPHILSQFQTEEMTFRTYHFERDPSIGTNIHALEAILLMDNYPDQEAVCKKVLDLVIQEKEKRGAWNDKWHISPLYIISHMIPALIHRTPFQSVLNEIIHDVWKQQSSNGAWGYHGESTLEETAYGLIILGHYYQTNPSGDLMKAILLGQSYLQEHWVGDQRYPELWIGKILYTPHRVVDITILSALILCENILRIETKSYNDGC